MSPVLQLTIPGVFEELTVLGNIDGKQKRYCDRFGNDERLSGPIYRVSEPSTLTLKDDVFRGGELSKTLEFNTIADCEQGIRGLPVFFETRYIFRVKCTDKVKDVRVYHRMALITDGFTFAGGWLFGNVDFINTPGRFTLALDVTFKDNSTRRINFTFTIVSVKMDVEDDYKQILGIIERERQGLVQNFLSKTFGDAGLDDKGDASLPSWYAILESVFDFYVGAVRQIVHNPHRRYERVEEWRHPDQIKRWTPKMANRYWMLADDRREAAWFRVERIEAEIDTKENRFVLHTLQDIAKGLREFAESYRSVKGISKECLDGVDDRARQLEELAEHPFFRGVGGYTGGGTESLVLQKRAGYAQILNAWLKLKYALSPSGEGIDVGYRPLSALYEFWTFLTTRNLLRKLLVETQGYVEVEDPKIADLEHLLDTDDEVHENQKTTLCRMGYRYEKNEGKTILLTYQQTYGTNEEGENFAIGYDQRPDIVMSIREGEDVYTYLFDAKYRVDEFGGKDASPRDAIDDMHRYRDAILYRRQQAGLSHEIIGAYVLFPGRLEHIYDYGEMREKENIGAFPLLPKPDYENAFGEFLKSLIDKRSKKEHLAKAMPTRGTTLVVGKGFSEEDIPTIELYGKDWPRLEDKIIKLPKTVTEKFELPTLIRLRGNNRAAIIVKLLSEHSRSPTDVSYNIDWTESGSVV